MRFLIYINLLILAGVIYATTLAPFNTLITHNNNESVAKTVCGLGSENNRSYSYSQCLSGQEKLSRLGQNQKRASFRNKTKTPENIVKETEASNYLLIWTADWCAYCPEMKRIGLKLQKEGYTVIFIDVDENKLRAKKEKIAGVPVAIIYTDNKEVERIIGMTSGTRNIELKIRSVLKKDTEQIDYEIY